MYHVELRQFPHNFCHFNLTEGELYETILGAWARGEWVEFGERKWSPQQAKLTVIEGPEIPVDQLSMGRGWSSARRHGHDVTERMLVAARSTTVAMSESAQTGEGAERDGGAGTAVALHDMELAADSVGLEVLTRLSAEPEPIALAWRLARERYPREPASHCLRLAEGAIRSLALARLIVVVADGSGKTARPCEPGAELDEMLRAIDSWGDAGGRESVRMRRA